MSDLRERQPNNEVPCLNRSDPVMLQKLSLHKFVLDSVNFQHSAFTTIQDIDIYLFFNLKAVTTRVPYWQSNMIDVQKFQQKVEISVSSS